MVFRWDSAYNTFFRAPDHSLFSEDGDDTLGL